MTDENKAGAPATFENTETADTTDVVSILQFDPFKKGDDIPEVKEEPKPVDKADTKPKTEGGDEKTNVAPASVPSKKEESVAKPGDQSADYWRGIAEAREAELKSAKAPKEAEKKDELEIPGYDFDIPNQLIEKLTSDKVEDFKVGVQALAKGIAGAIHAQMYGHLKKTYDPRLEGLPAQAMQMFQAYQQNLAIANDFYGTYPELNHQPLRPVIQKLGEDVAKELGKKEWDQELRDEIAKRAMAMLKMQPKAKESTPTPPKMLPSSGARTAPSSADQVVRDITETLFSEF